MNNDIELGQVGKSGNKQALLKENNYDIRRAAHPFACIFHLLFKGSAFISYLFLGLFISSSIVQYIIIILCNAFDFWTVKNITGRLLVGLRWWSQYSKNGKEVWKFDSMPKENSPVDSTIFWTFQLGSTVAWAVLSVLNFMTFSIVDVILTSIGFVLSGINLWGYYKCSQDQQKKMRHLQAMITQKGVLYALNRR